MLHWVAFGEYLITKMLTSKTSPGFDLTHGSLFPLGFEILS